MKDGTNITARKRVQTWQVTHTHAQNDPPPKEVNGRAPTGRIKTSVLRVLQCVTEAGRLSQR